MAATQWIRLNKEQAGEVIDRLAARKDAVVFSRDLTEVSWQQLPFYSRFRLYKLTTYATLPVFTLTYLADSSEFIALDGTANPIYTADEKDPVRIDANNVIAYLEFFFSHVQGSEGDVFLIRDPHKIPFIRNFTPGQRQSIEQSFRPVQVSEDDGTLHVTGTLHYGGGILAATIVVQPDGKIAFEEQSLLLSGIHFPDSPYATSAFVGG